LLFWEKLRLSGANTTALLLVAALVSEWQLVFVMLGLVVARAGVRLLKVMDEYAHRVVCSDAKRE
jgi:hypothetical protein